MTRILVVEDEKPIRELLADMLLEYGYEVDSARDGEAALARMHDHVPDVILLDLMMPGMDGWSFVRTLRNLTRWGSIPIVVVSAIADLPAAAARLGVVSCITKPFDMDLLVQRVEEAAASGAARPQAPAPT